MPLLEEAGVAECKAWGPHAALRTMNKAAEGMVDLLDRVAAPEVGDPPAGGAQLSDGMTQDGSKDCGQHQHFDALRGGPAPDIHGAVHTAMPKEDEEKEFFVCRHCNTPTQDMKRHEKNCNKLPKGTRAEYDGMSADWVLTTLAMAKNPDDHPFIRVYTFETPMCFRGNRSTRDLAFGGLDPQKDKDWLMFQKYEYGLHLELFKLPRE
eukprot:gene37869-2659_t